MQDHPGAPGTARQESTRIIVSTNDGGNATQPRAPGHERPPAALSAARHGRLSAATGAPGADVPLASTAGAPGQYCLSAAPRAPGHDVSLASPVRAPGHDRLSAAPIATVSLPAGLRRLRQEVLPRVPATPNTLIHPHSRANAASFPRQRDSGHAPTSPGAPRVVPVPLYSGETLNWADFASRMLPVPLRSGGTIGGPVRRSSHAHTDLLSHLTTHQVHPAIQVPARPRSCSTACTGFSLHHPSRAPPTTAHHP